MLTMIALIFLLLLLVSLYRDNRSLSNPFLLFFFLVSFYLALLDLAYYYQLNLLGSFLLLAGFALIPFLVLLSGLFLIYNGLILLRKEGKSKTNYLSLGLGIIIVSFFILYFIYLTFWKYLVVLPYLSILVNLFVFSYLLFGTIFAALLIYSFLYNLIPKKKTYDFIIIHGAGLLDGERVSPLLQKRIDKALEVFHHTTNPAMQLIASGGQGPDEKVSEAQAIAKALKQQGIPDDRILMEDRSRSTYENLLFSKKIGESLIKTPRFLFVTNDYHVFRTSFYAKKIGLSGDGLGCRTASYYIPSAFIREYIAILVKLRWGIAAIYLILIVLLIFSHFVHW